jgi:hypothetical protein
LELGLAAKLVTELVEAADEKQLSRTIARYGRVDLLYIDELVRGWLVRTFHAALEAPLLALDARGRRAPVRARSLSGQRTRCLGPSCRRPPCLPSSGRGLGPDLST